MHLILLILSSLICLIDSQGIPKELRRKLKHAHSFADFVNDIEVIYHPEHTNKHVNKIYSNARAPSMKQRVLSGSMIKQASNKQIAKSMSQSGYEPEQINSRIPSEVHDIDDHTVDHLGLVGSIRQGNDTCQLQSVCVPIPIENNDPQIIIFPKCYEVMQCVGSCCDSFEKCHPHSIREVMKPVVEMVYIGNNRFMLNKTMNITMEEHTACSCLDCGVNAPDCPEGFTLGSSCQCECINRGERNNCQGMNQQTTFSTVPEIIVTDEPDDQGQSTSSYSGPEPTDILQVTTDTPETEIVDKTGDTLENQPAYSPYAERNSHETSRQNEVEVPTVTATYAGNLVEVPSSSHTWNNNHRHSYRRRHRHRGKMVDITL